MISAFSLSLISVLSYMTFMYILSRFMKNNSIVDIAWGPGFIVATSILLFHNFQFSISRIMLEAMILVWGCRLGIHIWLRNRKKAEDFRYAEWRKQWGKMEPLYAFLKVFMLQAAVMLLLLVPVILFFSSETTEFGYFQYAGIVIFVAGFLFESIADYQLSVFTKKKENRGSVIVTGLWKYSRHPNYFGEAVTWWGIWLFTLNSSTGIAGIISPVLISLLLRFGSGVPMLEKKFRERKGFRDYAEKTPVFVPFIGKKGL